MLALEIFPLGSKPQRLNRIALTYRHSWSATTYGMPFNWIDPKTKKIPLVIVRSFSKGVYGPLGLEHVVVFPGGWKRQANVANLDFGAWRASDIGG